MNGVLHITSGDTIGGSLSGSGLPRYPVNGHPDQEAAQAQAQSEGKGIRPDGDSRQDAQPAQKAEEGKEAPCGETEESGPGISSLEEYHGRTRDEHPFRHDLGGQPKCRQYALEPRRHQKSRRAHQDCG